MSEPDTLEYSKLHPEVRLVDRHVDLVTRAIGSSIDGFGFEMSEASYGTPGEIRVLGKVVDTGDMFWVKLQIVAAEEHFDDDDLEIEDVEDDDDDV